MATNYGGRYSKPLGASRHAMGGAAEDLDIGALIGEGDFITVFDDFNGVVTTEGFDSATNFETMGWILSEEQAGAGAVTDDEVSMNDPANVDTDFDSCIKIMPGTDADKGGNMQLDRVNASLPASSGGGDFPHLWLPDPQSVGNYGSAAAAAALDNSTWVFATRVGLRADITTTGDGDWDGKMFIGWAQAGDTSVMTFGTGAITVANTGPLVGFHIPEDGSIDGICRRTVGATAFAAGTDFTELRAAGAVDGTLANGADTVGDTMWFDLAFRLDIADVSEATGNGICTFYHRKVLPGLPSEAWIRHPTQLTDQIPNTNINLVPTIEVLVGDTAGVDCVVWIDWWMFARNRPNRRMS